MKNPTDNKATYGPHNFGHDFTIEITDNVLTFKNPAGSIIGIDKELDGDITNDDLCWGEILAPAKYKIAAVAVRHGHYKDRVAFYGVAHEPVVFLDEDTIVSTVYRSPIWSDSAPGEKADGVNVIANSSDFYDFLIGGQKVTDEYSVGRGIFIWKSPNASPPNTKVYWETECLLSVFVTDNTTLKIS